MQIPTMERNLLLDKRITPCLRANWTGGTENRTLSFLASIQPQAIDQLCGLVFSRSTITTHVLQFDRPNTVMPTSMKNKLE